MAWIVSTINIQRLIKECNIFLGKAQNARGERRPTLENCQEDRKTPAKWAVRSTAVLYGCRSWTDFDLSHIKRIGYRVEGGSG